MFVYENISPTERLRPYVKYIWQITKINDEGGSLFIVPDGFPELMFNLNGSFRFVNSDGSSFVTSPITYLAQHSQTCELDADVGDRCVFVKFYPWVLHQLITDSMHEVLDNAGDYMTSCRVPPHPGFFDELKAAKSLRQSLPIMDEYLYDTLKSCEHYSIPILIYSMKRMLDNKGRGKPDDYYSEIKCSRRYLEKLYKKHIGLPPSSYLQILKTKEIANIIASGDYDTLGSLARSFGFHDQSHFSNAFNKRVKMTPSAFRRYMRKFPLIKNEFHHQSHTAVEHFSQHSMAR